jgi:preprotein translocase subunit SecB
MAPKETKKTSDAAKETKAAKATKPKTATTKASANKASNGAPDTAATTASTQPQATGNPEFGIQQIFVKDVSFETPTKHQLPDKTWHPNIDVELNASTTKLADNLYQVQLAITTTAKVEDKTAFLVEVKQAGIFSIKNFSDPQLHRMLGSYCPNVLFPYARELISDMVTRGGFPPLYLAPINFDVLYDQQLQKQQAQKQSTAATQTEK